MQREFGPTVYILSSRRNGTLYTGVTSNLARIHQHREGTVPGFTREYNVKMLVWFEPHATMEQAWEERRFGPEWLMKRT
jgi:putative endonuclease